KVIAHHGVFGLRFEKRDFGWCQIATNSIAPVTFAHIDVSGMEPEQRQAEVEEAALKLQRGFDISHGKFAGAAYFYFGPHTASRFLVAFHHLVVDGVSWRILIEDLEIAYRQLIRNDDVRLPTSRFGFPAWAERLRQYAQSSPLIKEVNYWTNELSGVQ